MTPRDSPPVDAEDRTEAASCEEVKRAGVLGKFRLWVVKNIVADVPTEIARCEFECRVARCPLEKIRVCQERTDYARTLTDTDARYEPSSE